MSKKIKKQARKAPSVAAATQTDSGPVMITGVKSTPSGRSSGASTFTGRSSEIEFKPDYSQTIKDLKRIGVLATTFMVVLIALSFFLR
jgi:hypothetical protein